MAKIRSNWMLVSIMAFCSATILTACTDYDDNPIFQQNSQIVGKWYAETNTPGIYENGSVSIEYEKVAQYGSFSDNGTGFWAIIFVNAAGHAIDIPGYFCGGNFKYTVIGNTINVKMGSAGIPLLKDMWEAEYGNGQLTVKGSDLLMPMSPITDEESWYVQSWLQELGFGATPLDYNINDDEFNKSNWRNVPAIYINDGSVNLTSENMKDPNNYKIVTLPWYKGGADLSTNLPADFCDNITPENGWNLVINRCGSIGLANNNYFALYNKWTGTLRFFYYQPAMTFTGNDHMWQIALTDELAQRAFWGYGLPSTQTIMDKSKICYDMGNTMSTYVTPYTGSMDNNGCIVPHEGWWAFDVDLSLYRPDAPDIDNNSIKVQMRSWTTQHVSLWSTMTATIEGEFKEKVSGSKGMSAASTAQGVMTSLQAAALMGSAIAGFKVASNTGGMGAVSALGSIAGVFGCGGALAGIFGKSDPKPMEATISLGMNGTIDTKGTIDASAITTGITSPTLFLSSFNRDKNTGFGQGVWNIKNHPQVYVYQDACFRMDWLNPTEYECNYYVFDPTSVEVELNPNVFPDDEIEWLQVDAHCIATSKMGIFGTDKYRDAFGVGSRYKNSSGTEEGSTTRVKHVDYRYIDFVKSVSPKGFDYMYYSPEESELDWPATIHDSGSFRIVGRGKKDSFAIEPILLRKNSIVDFTSSNAMIPGLEVNVVVQVKMKDREEPFILSRNYLPQMNMFSYSDIENGHIFDHIRTATVNPKQEGHTDSFDYQRERFFKSVDYVMELANEASNN